MSDQVAWIGGTRGEGGRGGRARVVTVEDDGVVFRSSVPVPPGGRIEGILEAMPVVRIRVKVHQCRRVDDGSYEIAGRLLDATRDVRQRLALAAATPPEGPERPDCEHTTDRGGHD